MEEQTNQGVAASPSMITPMEEVQRAARALAEKYKIDSAFVRVSVLSRILGLAAPTIYAAMKAGRFPIPHRKVGSTPLVKLDDLARWYCAENLPSARPLPIPQSDANRPTVIDEAAKARLVKKVLRELREEGE
ncbi:hypothetical protein G2912_14010 [Paraburkholderia aspalathi]|uniref:DNA-binding protein n=1 Tax=Paraburkholderia nemoris TaxID=2793076 RepID=A0ABM8RMC6_9BURK|nr:MULTISPECIES: hypothetical protein [Paraburkholderia]MBK3811469.1 hypothetical protein [Paraburkholderia aspalathi]CAE6760988.1 hypothetical protein R69776_03371 [Paraburkholderia nemoris]